MIGASVLFKCSIVPLSTVFRMSCGGPPWEKSCMLKLMMTMHRMLLEALLHRWKLLCRFTLEYLFWNCKGELMMTSLTLDIVALTYLLPRKFLDKMSDFVGWRVFVTLKYHTPHPSCVGKLKPTYHCAAFYCWRSYRPFTLLVICCPIIGLPLLRRARGLPVSLEDTLPRPPQKAPHICAFHLSQN